LDRSQAPQHGATNGDGGAIAATITRDQRTAPAALAVTVKKAAGNGAGGGESRSAPKNASRQQSDTLAAAQGGAVFSIEMLPAGHGDSLWIEYGDERKRSRVLIDCGTKSTYASLQKRVADLKASQREFELFVLSHIDDDHIGGAIPFFADEDLGVHFDDV